MVGRVLASNGITTHAGGLYSLIGADDLSENERDELLQLCREKLDASVSHAHQWVNPLPGVSRAKSRCECCGVLQSYSHRERDALTKARLGQGLFQHRVAEQELICRVTALERQEFLIASHIKPWRDSNHQERLDGANGLLLSPHVDKLFNRHWISFDCDGQLIWEHEAAGDALCCWGIEGGNVIQPFKREQEQYLQLHRNYLR